MKNILIAPDKFKGSLTAKQVCEVVEEAILEIQPKSKVTAVPMADGGEGSLLVLKDRLDTETVGMYVKNPLFQTIEASYERKGEIAYIEMAAASGLQLVKEKQRNPLYTTTYGTGQLIKHAVKNACKEVYLFVGGSATNDGGMGMLQALGFQFLNEKGEELFGVGESMSLVTKIVPPASPLKFSIKIVCDVESVFYGPQGSAYTYGAQKGADEPMIRVLDQGLKNLARRYKKDLGKDIATLPGSGAAGGISGGALAGLGAQVASGVSTIMGLINFESYLSEVDLLITGEGKIDHQTLQGKLIKGVAGAAAKRKIPCIAFCGVNDLNSAEIESIPLSAVYSLKSAEMTLEYAVSHAAELLKNRVSLFIKSQ